VLTAEGKAGLGVANLRWRVRMLPWRSMSRGILACSDVGRNGGRNGGSLRVRRGLAEGRGTLSLRAMVRRSGKTGIALLRIALGVLIGCLAAAAGTAAETTKGTVAPAASGVRRPARVSTDELFFGTLRRFARWLDDSHTNLPLVEARAEITATEGLPAGLVGQKFLYHLQAPEHAQLQGSFGREPFILGRDRNELWLLRPRKNLVWRARSTSEDPVGPLSLPLMGMWVDRLPAIFAVRREAAGRVGDVRCEVVTGVTQSSARRWLGWPEFQLTLWFGEADHRLRQFRVVVPGDRWAVTVLVRTLQERAPGSGPRWGAPMGATNRVEWVTLPRVRGVFPESFHALGLVELLAP